MARRRKSQILSIFGQIEAVVAEVMIKAGEMTHIPAERIPERAAVNERGEPALFAVVVAAEKLERFNELIADLRA